MFKNKIMNTITKVAMGFMLVAMPLGVGVQTYPNAPIVVRADDDSDSKENMRAMAEAAKEMFNSKDSTFQKADGSGPMSRQELWTYDADDNAMPVIDTEKLNKLSQKDQEKVMAEITDYCDELVRAEGSDVTDVTVSNWLNNYNGGVGTAYINQITGGIKPNFAEGKKLWKPFEGPINIALGFLTILLFSVLTLSILLDIIYITVPPIRMMMQASNKGNGGHGGHGGRGGSGQAPAYISRQADLAVEAEGGGANGQGGKNALWVYFSKSVVKLIVLGICIMFLISGQINMIVGWVLNIVSGMLGITSI